MYIFAGDIFQANLSQRFEAALDESAWDLYRRLRRHNAAPFAAFIELPEAAVSERIAGAVPPPRRAAARRDAANQGDAASRLWSGTRCRARPGPHRERQGSRREPDDRGFDAQRPVTRLRARHRARSGALCTRTVRHRAPSGFDGRRRARGRVRWIRFAPGRLSGRVDHRRAQAAGHGDHRRARTIAIVVWTADDRLLERDRRARYAASQYGRR